MADSHEQRTEDLAESLMGSYLSLRLACEVLPIPLRLPLMDDEAGITALAEAAHEAALTVRSEPIPAGIAQILGEVLHLWIGGSLLIEVAYYAETEVSYGAAAELVRQIAYGTRLVISLLTELDRQVE